MELALQNETVQEILNRLFKHHDYYDTQPGPSASSVFNLTTFTSDTEHTKNDNWNTLTIPTKMKHKHTVCIHIT